MKREGKDNANAVQVADADADDAGPGPYADPTSAIWAWNLVGYIACTRICCLWNSNYVEPHKALETESLSLSVRSERWKVRYPPPQVCLYPLARQQNQQTHTHTEHTYTEIKSERMLSKPFCSVYCLACHAKAIYCRFAPKIESGLCAFIDR